MIRQSQVTLVAAAALIGFWVSTPGRAQAQNLSLTSVLVVSHTNIMDGQVVSECGTAMDPATQMQYPTAAAECQLLADDQDVGGSFTCPENSPAVLCSQTSSLTAGVKLQTKGRHGLFMNLIPQGCIDSTGTLVACWLDALGYGIPLGDPVPDYADSHNVTPTGTPVAVANTDNILIATTHETPFTTLTVTPASSQVIVNDQVNLTSDRPSNWTLSGIGTISASATNVTGITYTAPASIKPSDGDAFVTSCDLDTSHAANCATASITLDPIHITVLGPDQVFTGTSDQFTANVTAGGITHPFDQSVTWSISRDDTNGAVSIDPASGVVTVGKVELSGNIFTVVATSNLDPKISNNRDVAIDVVNVKVILVDPMPIVGKGNTFVHFQLQVTGTSIAYPQKWSAPEGQGTFPDPSVGTFQWGPLDQGEDGAAPIVGCIIVGKDSTGNDIKICDRYNLVFDAPVDVTPDTPTVDSGATTSLNLACTGCGSAPSFASNSTGTFQVNSITVSGVTTTINASVTPIPSLTPSTMLVSGVSSLRDALVGKAFLATRPVSVVPLVAPASTTLLVSQQQQFATSLSCVSAGGRPCTVPQGFMCSLPPNSPGTMDSTKCLYTAPASIPTPTTVNAQACPVFGGACVTVPITLNPVTVVVKPASAQIGSGKTVQMQAVVTNVPNNNQGVSWSISSTPAYGHIDSATGLYTAPAAVPSPQSDTIRACSVVDGNQCSMATVMLLADKLGFVPLPPCRVADTRSPNGLLGGPFLVGKTSRGFPVTASSCGVPANAEAYSLNVTVVPHGILGFLTMYPCGTAVPQTSTLNSIDGRVKAAAVILPAGVNGGACAFVSNDTDLVMDINGYFVGPSAGASGLAFYPVAPCRIADTRGAVGTFGGPSLAGNSSRSFPVPASSCHIPAAAQAYSLNFTAVPKTTLGFVTAWPTGQTQPNVSTLNAPTGTVTANAAIVPAGTNGSVSLFSTNDIDLVIDINGYFAPPGPGGLSLVNIAPCRVIDTRNPAGSPPFSGPINVSLSGPPCTVPASAQSFVVNATVVPPGVLGFITLWAQGGTQPLVSTLNANDGAVTSNMAIVPSGSGSISVFASNPTHLVLDVLGYFAP